jgi:hypothetical protein
MTGIEEKTAALLLGRLYLGQKVIHKVHNGEYNIKVCCSGSVVGVTIGWDGIVSYDIQFPYSNKITLLAGYFPNPCLEPVYE